MAANVYFDIETIPSQSPALKELALTKAAERSELPLTEAQLEEAYRQTALNGVFGEVVSIAYAVEDGEVESITRPDLTPESEARTLRLFWQAVRPLRSIHWIGYNIAGFDIQFLHARSIIHTAKPGFKFPPDTAPWKGEITDLMHVFCGVRSRNSARFAEVCAALGIPSPKTEMDGGGVWDAVQQGRFEDVARYCRADVEATRLVHKRAMFQAEGQ